VTDPASRHGSERPRSTAGRGRALVIAAGVLLIVLASVALAFVLGGGFGATTPAQSSTAAAAASLAPEPSGSAPEPSGPTTGVPTPTPGMGTPAATTPGASATTPTATPGDSLGVGIRAKRIHIDRLKINLAIIEGDGIDAPIGKAAHFPSSGWPDGGTNIYIYGHARTGMFLSLWDAQKGDIIVLDLVDGTSRTYVVTKVLPKVPWDAVQYLDPTPTEQLTLQTSTSYYATAPRFIVIAVPQP